MLYHNMPTISEPMNANTINKLEAHVDTIVNSIINQEEVDLLKFEIINKRPNGREMLLTKLKKAMSDKNKGESGIKEHLKDTTPTNDLSKYIQDNMHLLLIIIVIASIM